MYKIAVLGDRDSIYGFAALGLEVFPVPSGEEGARTLRRLSEQDYAVVYVTEALAAEMPAELERCRDPHPRGTRKHRHGYRHGEALGGAGRGLRHYFQRQLK